MMNREISLVFGDGNQHPLYLPEAVCRFRLLSRVLQEKYRAWNLRWKRDHNLDEEKVESQTRLIALDR